ncbi:hypothetical protein INR49_020128 [Caranx melampygus]|nr:hypothetical protein INR49_020128 [Caranx melampygus]
MDDSSWMWNMSNVIKDEEVTIRVGQGYAVLPGHEDLTNVTQCYLRPRILINNQWVVSMGTGPGVLAEHLAYHITIGTRPSTEKQTEKDVLRGARRVEATEPDSLPRGYEHQLQHRVKRSQRAPWDIGPDMMDRHGPTIAGLQVVLNVCVEVTAQTTGSSHKLWAEFDVDGATASIPGQREAVLLRHQDILRDLLQLQVMDVVRQLQTKERDSESTRNLLGSFESGGFVSSRCRRVWTDLDNDAGLGGVLAVPQQSSVGSGQHHLVKTLRLDSRCSLRCSIRLIPEAARRAPQEPLHLLINIKYARIAGEAEFEVPEGATGRVKRPDAHQEQDDVGGDKAGNVLGVLEAISHTHQTRHHQVTNNDSSHRPPALLLTGIKEDDSPEHVEQDDGHGHEG